MRISSQRSLSRAAGMALLLSVSSSAPAHNQSSAGDGVVDAARDAQGVIVTSSAQNSRTIRLDAQKRYRIDVSSTEFDPRITLLAPSGEMVAQEEENGDGHDAVLDVAPETSGLYQVQISTTQSNRPITGHYTFSLKELPPLLPPLQVKPDATATLSLVTYAGELSPTDNLIQDRYADDYAFTFQAGKTVLIFLDSETMPTVLQVYAPGKRESGESVADSIGRGDSRTAFLAFTPEMSGNYVIRATSGDPRTSGRYRLRIVHMP